MQELYKCCPYAYKTLSHLVYVKYRRVVVKPLFKILWSNREIVQILYGHLMQDDRFSTVFNQISETPKFYTFLETTRNCTKLRKVVVNGIFAVDNAFVTVSGFHQSIEMLWNEDG